MRKPVSWNLYAIQTQLANLHTFNAAKEVRFYYFSLIIQDSMVASPMSLAAFESLILTMHWNGSGFLWMERNKTIA